VITIAMMVDFDDSPTLHSFINQSLPPLMR